MTASLDTLTALSPLDGRYMRQVALLRGYFSEYALIRYRVKVEVAYFIALRAELGRPPAPEAIAALERLAGGLGADDARAIKASEAEIRHDVKAVEYWLKARVAELPAIAPDVELVHAGLTSEDVNNLAYAGMQRDALRAVVWPTLGAVLQALSDGALRHKDAPMLSRTHGQPATPTTMGKELGVYVSRLAGELHAALALELPGKLTGATGTLAAHRAAWPEHDWPAFSRRFVAAQGLAPSIVTTQIEPRDGYAALYDALRRINGILLDLAADVWRYISDGYFRQQARSGEVGSSAMPHKVNPIDFENAEGNLGVANALLHHLGEKLVRSRLQRDLSDSTALRNVGVAFGHSLLAYQNLVAGLARLDLDADRLAADLAAHPEVLAEAVQTVLRADGHAEPYEALKALTRGQSLTLEALRAEATRLAPAHAERWARLSPESYLGYAPQLAEEAVKRARPVLRTIEKLQKRS